MWRYIIYYFNWLLIIFNHWWSDFFVYTGTCTFTGYKLSLEHGMRTWSRSQESLQRARMECIYNIHAVVAATFIYLNTVAYSSIYIP